MFTANPNWINKMERLLASKKHTHPLGLLCPNQLPKGFRRRRCYHAVSLYIALEAESRDSSSSHVKIRREFAGLTHSGLQVVG
jgi:hypothetical protein